tara:strand:+ start:363 stop:485 length:123 start_codon:yes stop_codon:yes gene_type:complete
MIKFVIGVIVGLYIGEYYDYTFSGMMDWIDSLLQNKNGVG